MKISSNLQKYNISAVYHAKRAIQKIIYNGLIIWSLITSCFGSGIWVELSPWSATDNWKNN